MRRKNMINRKIFVSVMCLSLIALTSVSASAGSVTWTTAYGKATGSSTTYTWSQPTSPTYRKVEAVTQNSMAAPKIAADVVGYYKGEQVMAAHNVANNSNNVSAVSNSSKYANKDVYGTGSHAVWSSTLARKTYYTSFK